MVLAEQAARHMKKEEDEIFPRLRHSRLDLVGTGERMAARKAQLATAPIDRRLIHQARKVMGGRPKAQATPAPLSVDLPRRHGDAAEAVIPDNSMSSNSTERVVRRRYWRMVAASCPP